MDREANILNNFEGVDLDAEARAEIYRTLTACAERRRALEQTPEHDPERRYIGVEETNAYLGQLESGVEGDWVEYRPEGEHRWESLGQGGNAAEIDEVLAGIEARKAAMTPEEIAADEAEHRAEVQRMREQQALPPPAQPDPDDPRLDWRNWDEKGYAAPSPDPAHPDALLSGVEPQTTEGQRPVEGRTGKRSPEPSRRARKPYKKRTPKPRFAPPDKKTYKTRKTKALAEVKVERREAATAEAERRERRQGSTGRTKSASPP